MNQKIIVLLDLNQTLAMETGYNPMTYKYDVQKDVYSVQLADLLKEGNYEVHLITARGAEYANETLKKIKDEIGFEPDKAIFKPASKRYMKVHDFKQEYLINLVEEGHDLGRIMAIESNHQTHKAYREVGLKQIYKRDQFIQLKT